MLLYLCLWTLTLSWSRRTILKKTCKHLKKQEQYPAILTWFSLGSQPIHNQMGKDTTRKLQVYCAFLNKRKWNLTDQWTLGKNTLLVPYSLYDLLSLLFLEDPIKKQLRFISDTFQSTFTHTSIYFKSQNLNLFPHLWLFANWTSLILKLILCLIPFISTLNCTCTVGSEWNQHFCCSMKSTFWAYALNWVKSTLCCIFKVKSNV